MLKQRLLFSAIIISFVGSSRANAEADFAKDIKPLLELKCLKCHVGDKPKGGLKLDSKEGLVKGSKTGPVVMTGKAAESEMYKRVTLPKDSEDRMPPEGEPLTKEQADKIRDWINEGNKWPDALVLKAPGGAGTAAKTVTPMDNPGLPITDAEKAALTKIQATGTLAMRLAQNTNLLRVDFSLGDKKVTPEMLAQLKDMPNLTELSLGGTDITDAGLVHIKPLVNLTKLQLQKTKITDAGLEILKGLQKLESLNIYGTEVTDKGLEQLKGLKNLKRLYVWQSKVTEAGAKGLTGAMPGIYIERGYDVATPAPAKPEDKKPEPMKDAKPDAAKDKKPDAAKDKAPDPPKKPDPAKDKKPDPPKDKKPDEKKTEPPKEKRPG